MGVGATLGMDGWNLFLKRAFGIPSLDYCLLGRWVRHMPGTFRHASIARTQPKAHECGACWIAHYSIGRSLALAFALTATDAWLARPTLLPALAYGLVRLRDSGTGNRSAGRAARAPASVLRVVVSDRPTARQRNWE
jgi:hypothetical protein